MRSVPITSVMSVFFVRMYQRRSHSTDFLEIRYWELHFDNKGNPILRFNDSAQRFILTATCSNKTEGTSGAFPLQQWLHKRATMSYAHCLLMLVVVSWHRGSMV